MEIEVGTILIGTTDLKKAKKFYTDIFCLSVEEFRPPFMSAKLGDVEFNIEEDADYREDGWSEKNIGGRKSVTFQVDDINQFIKNAKGNSAQIISEPKKQPWGWIEVVVADFDGNEFIVEQKA